MGSTLNHLSTKFAPANAITRADFRSYLGISVSTDCRLKRAGHYPRVINLTGTEKILLTDLAEWLDRGGAPAAKQGRLRGRPKGSRNKPKPNPIPSYSPMLPAHMGVCSPA